MLNTCKNLVVNYALHSATRNQNVFFDIPVFGGLVEPSSHMLGAMFEEGVRGLEVEGNNKIKKASAIVSWDIVVRKLLTRVKVKTTNDATLLPPGTAKIHIEIPRQDQLVVGRSTLQAGKKQQVEIIFGFFIPNHFCWCIS